MNVCPPFPYATPLSAPFCFHYSFSLCFSVSILSLCLPLTLFPFRYPVATIFIQQLEAIHVYLCFLYTTPDPLPPFFSSFLALLLPLIHCFDQYSPLYLLPCFPSQFFFNIVTFHSPLICPSYFPLLSWFCPILLDLLSPVPPLYPFISALSNAASLMLTFKCLYYFYLSSTFYLLVPFFFYLITNVLPQLMSPPPLSFCLVPPLSFIS